MKILYFSGTGNSLYVSKKIGGELLSIPQLIRNNQYKIVDDMVGIVCPVYCMTIPNLVKEYLTQVEINCDYLFVILTYGSSHFNSLSDVTRVLNKKGLKINYSNYVLMVDNFIPSYDIKEQKELHDNRLIALEVDKIKDDIFVRKNYQPSIKKVRDKIMELVYKVIYKVFLQFAVNLYFDYEVCNHCKVCYDICPKGNIELNDNIPFFNDICAYCLACIQNCPQGAIHDKREKNSEHFRNPNVKLSELIQSNKQN